MCESGIEHLRRRDDVEFVLGIILNDDLMDDVRRPRWPGSHGVAVPTVPAGALSVCLCA
jgi:hypothetical protein